MLDSNQNTANFAVLRQSNLYEKHLKNLASVRCMSIFIHLTFSEWDISKMMHRMPDLKYPVFQYC